MGGWEEAFVAGEALGARPLREVVVDAERLSPELREVFWDGVAHGLPLQEDVPAFVAEVTEHAPSTVHDLLYEGAIRAFTERHAEQPEQVLAYQAEVRRVAGLADNGGVNGVRIGLQRALGYDLRRAIEVGQRYPEEVQPAILEELGWRLGDELPRSAEAPARHAAVYLDLIAPARHCLFVHGVVRGWSMRFLEAGGSIDLRGVPEECGDAGTRGLAWAAWTLRGGGIEAKRLVDQGLPEGAARERAHGALVSIESSSANRGRPARLWEAFED